MKSSLANARTLGLFALFLATGSVAQGPFLNIPVYTTPGTGSLAAADLNKDGYPDLIGTYVDSSGNGFVTVQLNKGDGTLKPAVSYAAGALTSTPVVADLNGDGNLDIVVANSTPFPAGSVPPGSTCVHGCVTVLLGKGDGTFQPAVTYTAQAGTLSVALGDVNGDGKVDVVASNTQANSISVLLGNGDGTLQAARNYAVVSPGQLVLADLNRDHKLDIAILNVNITNPGFSVLLGNGDGTFQSAVAYATTANPDYLTSADFDSDGNVDLAIGALDALGTIDVVLGRGDGTFKPAILVTANLDPHYGLTAADVNGDGNTDLVMSSMTGFTVILGTGNGNFKPAANYSGVYYATTIALADFDRDGHLDIAIPNLGGTSILRGFGDGTFAAPRLFAGGVDAAGTAIGDFNGDGILDIAHTKGILLGVGDGTFTSGSAFSAGNGPSGVAADFNNDGKLDFAFADEAPKGKVYVGLGNGDGTFTKPVIHAVDKNPYSVAVGDFNRDGKADLVTADFGTSDISVLLGNGNGTFLTAVNYPAGPQTIGAAVADFNGDGIEDVAVINTGNQFGGQTAGVFLGNGDGTFQPQVNYPIYGDSIAVGDFNGDGRLDLLVASYVGTSVLPGNGDGTFQSAITTLNVSGGFYVVAADFNGDGKLDVATIGTGQGSGGGTIYVQYGNGDGTFQSPIPYGAGLYPLGMSTGDFNGDGAPDLAVGAFNGVTVELNARGTFLNTAAAPNPATLQQPVTLTTTVNASVQKSSLPTGSVTFKDGPNNLGSAPVVNGQARLITSSATAGTHTITPAYSGDANFNPHGGAPVTENVLSPKVSFSSGSLTFPAQKVGTTSAPVSLKLTNRGAGALLISGIAITGDFHQTNNCPASLSSNSSCTISVTFAPTKTGTRSGILSVTDNATNSPQKVSLTGTGD